ncbi:MAG: alpha/beta hydrolase [Candidatus Eisenbacteria bacterium]
MLRMFFLVVVMGALGMSCAAGARALAREDTLGLAPSSWVDGDGFTNRVIVAHGTTLHSIDYGGEGPAMVFLAGLGNSAHVFDQFAPRFSDRAHVYALTRRGYGRAAGRGRATTPRRWPRTCAHSSTRSASIAPCSWVTRSQATS